MFGPKHTIESVAKELIDGLEDGTVTLHPKEPTETDIEHFRKSMAEAFERYRRREVIMRTVAAGLLVSIAVALASAVTTFSFDAGSKLQPEEPYSRWTVTFLGCIATLTAAAMLGYRAGKRAAEVRAYDGFLKMADDTTARRILLHEGPRFQARELVSQN